MLIKLLYDQDIFLGNFLNLRYNKLSMIVDNYYIYNTYNFRWSCFPQMIVLYSPLGLPTIYECVSLCILLQIIFYLMTFCADI